MITTTLKRILARHPSKENWKKLLTGLGKTEGDDKPLPFAKIVEISGINDALWCCRAEPQYDREWRLFAVWCARQVKHLIVDPRSIAALDVAERYTRGEATGAELASALTNARAASTRSTTEAALAAEAALATAALAASAASATYAAVLASAVADSAVQVVVAAQTREFIRVVTLTENRT